MTFLDTEVAAALKHESQRQRRECKEGKKGEGDQEHGVAVERRGAFNESCLQFSRSRTVSGWTDRTVPLALGFVLGED